MVSFGGGKKKTKSKSQSTQNETLQFNSPFFEEATDYFGDEPEYDPEYVGFEDFDRLENTLYDTQRAKAHDAYQGAKKMRGEELSLAGLLNSPSRYMEGGADDTLDKNYISSLQQAARDAAMGRLGATERELTRRTQFNVDTATKLFNSFLQKLQLAISAGNRSRSGTETSTGSGSGFDWGSGFTIGGKS